MSVPAADRLVEEATKKSGLVWVRPAGSTRAHPAWHVWTGGAAYVVLGGSEQPLPGLVDAERAEVTVPSKDTGGRLVTWVAQVTRVLPDAQEWQDVVPALAAKRLNAVDSEEQVQRWAREAAVIRLAPTGEVPQAPGTMPTDGGAAPPPPSPATTSGPPPFVLGRSRRRRRG